MLDLLYKTSKLPLIKLHFLGIFNKISQKKIALNLGKINAKI